MLQSRSPRNVVAMAIAAPDRSRACDPLSDRWTRLLIENDRHYFAAGAIVVPTLGARLTLMRGLEAYAAGAVLLVDDPATVIDTPARWRETAVAAATAAGATTLRFYTAATDPVLTDALVSAGMEHTEEMAMAGAAAHVIRVTARPAASRWRIRQIDSAELWERKLALHARTPERPDGKIMSSERWVRFEKAKADAGYMDAYLVEHDGEPAGAFGLSRAPGLHRLKNIVVSPDHRHRGAATAMIRWLAARAIDEGVDALGCFAIPDTAGERVYARCGMRQVGAQLEWLWPLAARSREIIGGSKRAVR